MAFGFGSVAPPSNPLEDISAQEWQNAANIPVTPAPPGAGPYDAAAEGWQQAQAAAAQSQPPALSDEDQRLLAMLDARVKAEDEAKARGQYIPQARMPQEVADAVSRRYEANNPPLSDEALLRHINEREGRAQAYKATKEDPHPLLSMVMRNVARGLPFESYLRAGLGGLPDYLLPEKMHGGAAEIARTGAPDPYGGTPEEGFWTRLANIQGQEMADWERSKLVTGGSQMLGGTALGALPRMFAGAGPGMQALGEGAVYGGLYGAGSSPNLREMPERAITGAAVGGPAGAAVAKTLGAAGRRIMGPSPLDEGELARTAAAAAAEVPGSEPGLGVVGGPVARSFAAGVKTMPGGAGLFEKTQGYQQAAARRIGELGMLEGGAPDAASQGAMAKAAGKEAVGLSKADEAAAAADLAAKTHPNYVTTDQDIQPILDAKAAIEAQRISRGDMTPFSSPAVENIINAHAPPQPQVIPGTNLVLQPGTPAYNMAVAKGQIPMPSPGGMSLEGLRGAKTKFGLDELPGRTDLNLPGNLDQGEARQMYTAIKAAHENAAESAGEMLAPGGGPTARAAANNSNQVSENARDLRDVVAKVLGKKRNQVTPEMAASRFQQAHRESSRGNQDFLNGIYDAADRIGVKDPVTGHTPMFMELRGNAIHGMGKSSITEPFTWGAFDKNYENMPAKLKDKIFGSPTPPVPIGKGPGQAKNFYESLALRKNLNLRDHLDNMLQLGKQHTQAERLTNTSATGNAVNWFRMLFHGGTAATGGALFGPLYGAAAALPSIGVDMLASKMIAGSLAHPITAERLAQLAAAHKYAMAGGAGAQNFINQAGRQFGYTAGQYLQNVPGYHLLRDRLQQLGQAEPTPAGQGRPLRPVGPSPYIPLPARPAAPVQPSQPVYRRVPTTRVPPPGG